MQTINWFPGHMHKARKDIADVMPHVDVIIEVLDARIPFSSENPMVPALRGNTPCIKLLNKADLADPIATQIWINELEKTKGIRAIPVSQENPEEIRQVLQLCESLTPERKASIHATRALILGIPNVGKSTIINTLAGKVLARTGNEAGITKSQQKIKLDRGILLTDTPGFLWPKLSPPGCGYRLASTGAIKDTVFDYTEVALFAVDFCAKNYPDAIKNRYSLSELSEIDLENLEAIGKQRGCTGRGGSIDLHKTATLFINELRAGLLGRITFESPEQITQEIEIAKIADEKKALEKAEADRIRKLKTKKNRN